MQPVRRPRRPGQRQRSLCIRAALGLAGGHAGGHRRCALGADAQRHHPHQRALSPRPARGRCCTLGNAAGPGLASRVVWPKLRANHEPLLLAVPSKPAPARPGCARRLWRGRRLGRHATADRNPAHGDSDRAAGPLSRLAGTITVTATASDDVAVTGVEFQIDGVTIGAIDTTAPYAVSLDTSLYPSGQHVVRARASDAEGNVSPWSTALVQFFRGISKPSGFTLDEAWITGLAGSTAFAQAPDGRIFVAQQLGTIRVIKDGALLPTPFATMTVDSSGERGVLGVALHPDFATNGFVYVYYDPHDGGSHNRISRYTAAATWRAGSEIALVDLPALPGADIHNGGAIHFGSDGKLYAGVGDAGEARSRRTCRVPSASCCASTRTARSRATTRSSPRRRPGARGLGLGPAQPVHLRGPTRYRQDPHQRCRRRTTWEEINLGVGRRQLRLAGLRRAGQHRRRLQLHRAAVHLSARRSRPPGSGPGGFITGSAVAGGTFYPPPARSPRATATSTTSPTSSTSSSPGSTPPTATPCTRSPSSRHGRSTCSWASTGRSTS